MGEMWWKRGVIYQIYPRSFADTDGDGVGDLNGITRRLGYLQWLGVDALWISPIFPSPMADFGYDVADYVGIDPVFGTLAEFDRLVAEAHARGLRVILDFVPNHSSDRHPWFADSRSSRTSAKRDWYIWRDPAPDGGPPNNWLSVFGGPGWTYDDVTRQYYCHAFLKEQPDLNWRNPGVRAAMMDVLRFWLERGVDGFRVDVIWHLIKDERFRDNPPNPGYQPDQWPYARLDPLYSTDRPEVLEVIAEMRRVVDAFGDRVLIGEIYLPLARLVRYYGANLDGVHLPFNFQLLKAAWRAPVIAELVRAYEAALPEGGWPNWVLGNHDSPRIASRVGEAQARVAAMLLLTLRGTPTLYYGDEIGMRDVPIAADRIRDPVARNLPALGLGRDPERTPMRWDDSPNAGFTDGLSWLPIGPEPDAINVAAQECDPRSILALHRRLLSLRGAETTLATGAWLPLACHGDVFAYERRSGGRRLAIALNFGGRPATAALPKRGRILLSTHLDRDDELVSDALELRPDEGVVAALDP